MTQYNSLNAKLSNLQLDKLKSAVENETKVALRLSSNMVGDYKKNLPHKLLSTKRQVANLRKAFSNYLSIDIKLSKTQVHLWRFLERLLDPLLKIGLQLMNNVIKALAKRVLIPLR